MLWGNNAENMYDFEINRVEPLRIPGFSRLTGPFRYDFFAGSMKGHTDPNDPRGARGEDQLQTDAGFRVRFFAHGYLGRQRT